MSRGVSIYSSKVVVTSAMLSMIVDKDGLES